MCLTNLGNRGRPSTGGGGGACGANRIWWSTALGIRTDAENRRRALAGRTQDPTREQKSVDRSEEFRRSPPDRRSGRGLMRYYGVLRYRIRTLVSEAAAPGKQQKPSRSLMDRRNEKKPWGQSGLLSLAGAEMKKSCTNGKLTREPGARTHPRRWINWRKRRTGGDAEGYRTRR